MTEPATEPNDASVDGFDVEAADAAGELADHEPREELVLLDEVRVEAQ
ncbi:hypothetical protein ACQEVF_57980 [Nonomuraea polychroma]